MHGDDPLPDLSRLQDLGGIDAVVVTHAHADHIGALPLAAGAFPLAPVIATPATAGLMAVMLEDAIRVGETRAENGGDLPAFGRPQVTTLLERLRPLPFGHPHPLFPAAGEADWLLTFFPAGHVLGAALALLETPEGNVLVSGDVSLAPQLTVGAAVPPRQRVDLLVLESTYGNRLHSQRAAEETRLIAQIREILGRGGHCLIPAFALGRAQEVLLILAAARSRGELAGPVWVDGLVRAVCGVYQAYAEAGSHVLRRLVARQGNPFVDADGPVRAIQRPEERSELLAGPPSVIVASSGMLTGGPSAFYAAKLAGDERHGILITGYQDEEAPGRRLLDLAQDPTPERRLVLDGVEIAVRCTVSRYNLSAHADGDELASLAERVRPALTCLVHGDDEARAGLAEKLLQRQLDCLLPRNGDTVEQTAKQERPSLAARPVPTEDKLLALARSAHPSRGWTALELAERYYGRATPAGVAAVAEILHAADSFVADRIRPMLYRVSPTQTLANAQAWGPVSQERARQRVEEAFGADPTFVKASLYPDERRLELRFHFPDVARVCHAAAVSGLATELGWEMTFRQTPDQNALQAAAKRRLPVELVTIGEPSVRADLQQVGVRVRGDRPPAAELAVAAAGFAAETGFQLVVRGDEPTEPAHGDESPASARANEPPTAEQATPGLSRLEQNLAFATIRESLEVDGARVFKISGRGDTLEVVFLTPAIGRRYQLQLRALEQSLGWPLTFASQPQQGALIDVVRTIVDRALARAPAVFPAEERVGVRLAPGETPSAADLQRWQEALLEATGYTLRVEAT
jgi:Cft2 family RNA processing exonuclease